jgi:predicted nucleic acid-binding protein
MILADTNAWKRHALSRRQTHPGFARLMEDGEVVCHPWIFGELILGGITDSAARNIAQLDFIPVASQDEMIAFIRRHRPQGIGWVDVNLLVSAIAAGADVLTLDGALRENAALHGRVAHASDRSA